MDATLLSSLMSCARFHDIRYNYRLVSMKGRSNSLEVGSLIHKVLEVYYKHRIKDFNRATATGQALAAGQLYVTGCQCCASVQEYVKDSQGRNIPLDCKHEPQEYPGLENTQEKSEGWNVGWRFALETCEQYFEHYKNDSFIPLTCEDVRREILYEDDEIRVGWKAKMDLVIDTHEIGIVSMDHKTFKQRRDKSSLSNQFSGHCCLLQSRSVIVNKIGLQSDTEDSRETNKGGRVLQFRSTPRMAVRDSSLLRLQVCSVSGVGILAS